MEGNREAGETVELPWVPGWWQGGEVTRVKGAAGGSGGHGHLSASQCQECPAAEDLRSWWVASCCSGKGQGGPDFEKLPVFLIGGSCWLLPLGFWPQSVSKFLLFLIITLWACRDHSLFLQSFSFFLFCNPWFIPPLPTFVVVLCCVWWLRCGEQLG